MVVTAEIKAGQRRIQLCAVGAAEIPARQPARALDLALGFSPEPRQLRASALA